MKKYTLIAQNIYKLNMKNNINPTIPNFNNFS